jgi:hypothetical protein
MEKNEGLIRPIVAANATNKSSRKNSWERKLFVFLLRLGSSFSMVCVINPDLKYVCGSINFIINKWFSFSENHRGFTAEQINYLINSRGLGGLFL